VKIQRKVAILAIGFISALNLLCCKVYKPEMPIESYKFQPQKPQTSVINLFADLEVTKLEALVNDRIDSVLYDDNSFENNDGDNLILKAWKDGEVSLKFNNEELTWELPIRIMMKKGLKVFNYKVPFIDSWEYSGNLKLRFKTRMAVTHDWSFKTTTITDGYEWIKSPSVHIGSTVIPLTIIGSLLLSANKEKISKRIDDTMAGSFNFRGIAEEGWKLMFKPFKIEGDYDVWLSVNPYSISLMPIEGSGGHIRFGAAVVSDVECLFDNIPKSGQVRVLPDLQQLKSGSNTFHISLFTDIPYTSIDRIINAEIDDSTFIFGTRKITFKSFRVYGSNGKLAMESQVGCGVSSEG